MPMYIGNAFSLSMLERGEEGLPAQIQMIPLGIDRARMYATHAQAVSVVGHQDTAAVMSSLLGVELKTQRISVKLTAGDQLLVGQYSGPRLPEGTTELPAGAAIQWWLVRA